MRPLPGLAREPEPARQIRFCATSAGVRVAYATAGRGPALLVPVAWISHLELLWQDPAVRAFFAPLAARRTVIQYDKPGCGLSDPWPGRQMLDTDLQVLQAVADHLQLERFDLLGISTAAPLSIAFAARHPARVGRLILYGGYADGPQVAAAEVRAAMLALVRAHWGLGSDVLADLFLPDASAETKEHFVRLQRGAAPAEVACGLLAQCYETRVGDLLETVAAPTLVLHRRGDRAIPYRLGRDLAARIPDAAGVAHGTEPFSVCGRRRGGGPGDPGVPGRSGAARCADGRAARRAPGHAHRPAAPGRGPGRRRLHQPADRRAAGDPGALGRGTRGADPPAAGRPPPR
jgi:pimeloyl-ACP methyl ester carboxylesterase